MAEKYHVGNEIKKELSAQGKSARWLANEICLTPQAVYDIFKKDDINTDRLIKIQRALGRDFFMEYSQYVKNGGVVANEEDESVLQERFALLMPEDKLRVLKRETYEELIEEFVLTEHHKPLVIFTNDPYIKGSVERVVDRELKTGKIYYVDLIGMRKKGISDDAIIRQVHAMPHPIMHVGCNGGNESFSFMVKLAQETGKKVFAYCLENPHLNNYTNNLEYYDRAIQLFSAWHEQIHFAYIDDERQAYRQTRLLFLANWGNDILSYIRAFIPILSKEENEKRIWEWLNNPQQLYDAYRKYLDVKAADLPRLKDFSLMYMDDEVDIKQNGLRWNISLPVDQLTVQSNHNVLMKIVPLHLSTWIDIDSNGIKDYEDSPLH